MEPNISPTPQTIDFENLVLQNQEALKQGDLEFTFDDIRNQMADGNPSPEGDPKPGEEINEGKGDDIVPPVTPQEEPKEPVAPVVTPEPKVDDKPLTDFSAVAKKLLSKGDWVDVLIDNGDGTEIKLSEMDNLDEETFETIWEEQKKASKEQLNEDYVPVKGIDENKKRLINIVAKGGDLKEIFQSEAQLRKPYENADLSDLQTQQNILYSFYINGQGLAEDEARELVIKATKDLTVDKKAESIVTQAHTNYEAHLKQVEADLIKQKNEEKAAIQEYRKNLSTLFKEDGLEDNLSRTLTDAATKEKDGQLYIDSVYEKMMKDPAQAKDLVFFMLERDKFLAKLGANVKRDVTIGTMRKVKLVQETAKPANIIQEEEVKSSSPFSNIVLPD